MILRARSTELDPNVVIEVGPTFVRTKIEAGRPFGYAAETAVEVKFAEGDILGLAAEAFNQTNIWKPDEIRGYDKFGHLIP